MYSSLFKVYKEHLYKNPMGTLYIPASPVDTIGDVIKHGRSDVGEYLENNRWFSAVLLCIYGDNHTRVVPYFESCMAPLDYP